MGKNFFLHQIISIVVYFIIFLGIVYSLIKNDFFFATPSINLINIIGIILFGYLIFEGLRFVILGLTGLILGKVESWGTGVSSWDYQFYPYRFFIYRKLYSVKGTKAQVIGVSWVALGLLFLTLPSFFFFKWFVNL